MTRFSFSRQPNTLLMLHHARSVTITIAIIIIIIASAVVGGIDPLGLFTLPLFQSYHAWLPPGLAHRTASCAGDSLDSHRLASFFHRVYFYPVVCPCGRPCFLSIAPVTLPRASRQSQLYVTHAPQQCMKLFHNIPPPTPPAWMTQTRARAGWDGSCLKLWGWSE